MSGHLFLPDSVGRYVNAMARESDVARRLREETMRLPMAGMLTTPDEAAFLALLVRMTNARHVLEIGTFTGYSALAMASALPQGGTLTALDVSREWTDIARRYWREAGVEARINLRLAPALESLKALAQEGATFDMAFIDADKQGYDVYYEACLSLMRQGGVIAFDNMLWGGAVADESIVDESTSALRALNAKIHADERVECCLLSVADGVMLAWKR